MPPPPCDRRYSAKTRSGEGARAGESTLAQANESRFSVRPGVDARRCVVESFGNEEPVLVLSGDTVLESSSAEEGDWTSGFPVRVVNDAAHGAGSGQSDPGAYKPDAESAPSEGTGDERRRSRLVVIAMGIGFSAFPVILLSAAVNSRVVGKFGVSLIMVPFLVISSMITASAFTAGRQTFRVRLGLVGVGLLIFVPATFALLGIWF